jgi:hypothetical protein
VTGPADGRRRGRLATLVETALAAERDSMHSPEHVAIIAKLIATIS